jgi:hypothetical protein
MPGRDASTTSPVERLGRVRSHWRPTLAVLLAAVAIGLTACGDSPDSPHIANLETSTTTGGGHGGVSTTTAPKGDNATQLMDEWATCMRANGDPNQTDPTIDLYGVINITMQGASQAVSSEVHGSSGPCSQYEVAAEDALRAANPVAPPPTQAQLVQYVDCMRTHGVPNFPDPGTNGETKFNGTGVDPNSLFVVTANKICGKQINAPAWWVAGDGPPGDVSVRNCSGPASVCSGPPPTGGNRPAVGAAGPSGSGAPSVPVTDG